MLDPRRQIRVGSTPSASVSSRAILPMSLKAAGDISSSDSPCPRWSKVSAAQP